MERKKKDAPQDSRKVARRREKERRGNTEVIMEAMEGNGNKRKLIMPITSHPPLWRVLLRAGFLWTLPNHCHYSLRDELLT